jgi:hypothetical protein
LLDSATRLKDKNLQILVKKERNLTKHNIKKKKYALKTRKRRKTQKT